MRCCTGKPPTLARSEGRPAHRSPTSHCMTAFHGSPPSLCGALSDADRCGADLSLPAARAGDLGLPQPEGHVPRHDARRRPVFRRGTDSPTVRVHGMTVAGR